MQYLFEPIGIVRCPLRERSEAPRQAGVPEQGAGFGGSADALIELLPGRGFEDALEGLAGWEYVWVLFVFHRNVEEARGWRPKVQPPRAEEKVGLFATRSPHRPNPIGMSAVKLHRIEGLAVHVCDVDLLDGTPVLDLKPYVAYADARPDARSGWLEPRDPRPAWQVAFRSVALEQLAWLRERGVELRPSIESALALGPQPHAYRRIRPHGNGMRLSLKEWRVDFVVTERRIVVQSIATGYRAKDLATRTDLEVHQAFVVRFA